MSLRPGNTGSNHFEDHKEVLTAALKQIPAAFRRRILVRVDGAGASHNLVRHLLALSSPRRSMLFTCGWTILDADEQAIAALPASAWDTGLSRAAAGKDEHADHAPDEQGGELRDGLRWIARRVKLWPGAPEEPDRIREENRLEVLDHLHKHSGRRDGRQRARQPPPPVHRRDAAGTTPRLRDQRRPHRESDGPEEPLLHENMAGQRSFWVITPTNIAADLTAWARLLALRLPRPGRPPRRRPGHAPLPDLAPPARLVRHARKRILKISPDWPWNDAFLTCWQGQAYANSRHPADQHQLPRRQERRAIPARSEPVREPDTGELRLPTREKAW